MGRFPPLPSRLLRLVAVDTCVRVLLDKSARAPVANDRRCASGGQVGDGPLEMRAAVMVFFLWNYLKRPPSS
eukprot:12906519-Prorocentrum_lima.AAC.1